MIGSAADDSAREDPQGAVRDRIRAAIVAGEFAPGQRLIEADLCERFDASRFIIRGALGELATQGLIEFQRNRGARVREVSMAEAIEITEVRRRLEGLIAVRAAEAITPETATALQEILTEMRAAVAAGELARYSGLNVTLHRRLRETAQQPIATAMLNQLRDLTVRHDFTLSLVPGRSAVSLPQHAAIVAAVCAGDAAGAEAAMHVHLTSVITALEALADPASRPGA